MQGAKGLDGNRQEENPQTPQFGDQGHGGTAHCRIDNMEKFEFNSVGL